jgi:hypothetical protein
MLITRMTDRQAKRLSKLYSKGSSVSRDEIPSEISNHIPTKSVNPALISPRASTIREHFSSEKKQTAEKIPITSIVIPLSKKQSLGNSGVKK